MGPFRIHCASWWVCKLSDLRVCLRTCKDSPDARLVDPVELFDHDMSMYTLFDEGLLELILYGTIHEDNGGGHR